MRVRLSTLMFKSLTFNCNFFHWIFTEPYKAKNKTFAKVPKKTKPEDCPSGTPKEKKKKAEKLENSSKQDTKNSPTKDDMFREFRRLCASLSNTSAYTSKTALIKQLFEKGSDGGTLFNSDKTFANTVSVLTWISVIRSSETGKAKDNGLIQRNRKNVIESVIVRL